MPCTSSPRSVTLGALGILSLILTACGGQSPGQQIKQATGQTAKDKQDQGKQSAKDTLPNGTSLPDGLMIKPALLSSSMPYLGKSTSDQAALKARVADANALHFALGVAMICRQV